MEWTPLQEDVWQRLMTWSRDGRNPPATRTLVLWGCSGSGKTQLVNQLSKDAQRRLIWYYPDASQDDIRGWKNSTQPLLWTYDADDLSSKDMASIVATISRWSRIKPTWIVFQWCRRPPEDLPKTWTCIRLLEKDMRPREGFMDPVIHNDEEWHACAESMGVGRMDDEFDYVPSEPFPFQPEWWDSRIWDDASVLDVLVKRTSRHDARFACMASACIYHQHLIIHKLT